MHCNRVNEAVDSDAGAKQLVCCSIDFVYFPKSFLKTKHFVALFAFLVVQLELGYYIVTYLLYRKLPAFHSSRNAEINFLLR